MKKLQSYILIAVILIGYVFLITFYMLVINDMRKDIRLIEARNIQLTDKTKQLEKSITELQKEAALKEDEYIELKENLAQQEINNSSDDADFAQVIIIENEPIISLSPDSKYRAEAYGTISTITAGGLYPYKAIHILNTNTGEAIWEMDSAGYSVEFVWSPDSRYLGIYYTGRIWGESIIVDISDNEIIKLPSIDAIASDYDDDVKPQENRPDPYFRIRGWENSETVIVEFNWTKDDGDVFNGQFSYNVKTNNIIYK